MIFPWPMSAVCLTQENSFLTNNRRGSLNKKHLSVYSYTPQQLYGPLARRIPRENTRPMTVFPSQQQKGVLWETRKTSSREGKTEKRNWLTFARFEECSIFSFIATISSRFFNLRWLLGLWVSDRRPFKCGARCTWGSPLFLFKCWWIDVMPCLLGGWRTQQRLRLRKN